MYRTLGTYQFRSTTGVKFPVETLQFPTRPMTDAQQIQWNWIMWKRTGGFFATNPDLTGLEASVTELNTLVGIDITKTIQAQINGKINISDATSLNVINTIVKRDNNGRTAVSLNDDNSTPRISLDNNYRILYHSTNYPSINWENCTLNNVNNNGIEIFCWKGGIGFFGHAVTSQIIGGSATAGSTYTSNERDMINKMYSALRDYGLLS